MTENLGHGGRCLFRNREVQGRLGCWQGPTAGLAGERVVARLPPLRKMPAHHSHFPSGMVGGGSL